MAAPNPVVFNETYYLLYNADVAAAVKAGAYKSGLDHWLAFGQFEDRPATPYFDWQVYRDNNQDLVDAGFNTKEALTQHFNQYGYKEARLYLSSSVFNADIYAAQNTDLAGANITSAIDLQQHFLNSGRYEGRIAIAGFDPVAYINSQPDLKALLAAGGNINGYGQADIAKAGWFHYLNFGIDEGRAVPTPNPAVTVTAATATVAEGAAQVFTVTLSVPLTTDTTFTYNVTGDTKGGALAAASAGDFTGVTGTVTIPAGQTKWTFSVTAVADGVTEGLEGYKVTLFDGNLNVVKTSDVVGITDSDAPVTSKTFTLTTGADAGSGFVGGSADDTFYSAFNLSGAATDGASTTLTAGDNLNGAGGVDTLVIAVSGSGSTPPSVTPTLASIEKVLVANSATAGTAEFNLSLADSSLTNVGTTSSTTSGVTTKFSSLNKIVAVEAKGAGNLDVNFADAVVSGTGHSLSLTLNGVGTSSGVSTFNTNGIETLNVTLASGASYLKLGTNTSADTNTVNVTGSSALSLDLGGGTGVTKVNASALSAGITITDINGDKVTLTGGAGSDTFDFTTAGGFNAGGTGTGILDVVAGGAGNDTLVINSTAVVADSAFTNVTSVETLKVTLGNDSGNIGLGSAAQAAGITTVTEVGTGKLNMSIATGYTGTVTVNLDTGSTNDSITVDASGNANLVVKASASAFANANTITITGNSATGTTDTLVLTANGSATYSSGSWAGTGSGAYLSSTVTNLDTITIATGSSATAGVYLDLTTANVASGSTLTINASALGSGASFFLEGSDITASGTGGVAKLNVTAGAGADSIIAGAGNDTIIGGAGNDTIDASVGGNDSLDGGDGDDTFILSGALTSGDTIIGGSGNDTLVLSSGTVTSAALANVVGVENLVFSGNATLNSPIQFSSFDLSLDAGAGSLTLASGYTGATTVTLGSGDTVDNTGANVDLVVNVTAANFGTGTGVVVAGSASSGSSASNSVTLNLTASFTGTGTGATTTLAAGSYIDKVVIVDGGDAASGGKDAIITLAANYNNSITIDGSALDAGTVTSGASNGDFENLTVNASTLTSGYTLTATGGAGDDSILGGAGNDTVLGGAGNDSIDGGAGNDSLVGGAGDDSITAGTGFDYVSGGDGNDVFVFGANFDGNDTVAGGSGNDTLSIDQGTGGVGDLAFLNVTSVETLVLSSGTGVVTLDTRAQNAGLNTIVATSGAVTVNAAGFTSGLTFNVAGNTSNLSLTGGAGNDSFVFSGSGLDNNDSIVGGSGADSLHLSNGTGVGTPVVAVAGTNIVGIESIVVDDNATNTGSTGSVTLTLTGNFNAGSGITVDASSLDATEAFTFTNNASGSATVTGGAGNDVITGHSTKADVIFAGAGNDTIVGGGGNDTIDGGSGDDVINGGAGVDVLTGGAGNDTFVIASGDSTSTGVDIITDFSSGDVIRLVTTLSSGSKIDATYKGAAASYSDALSLLTGTTGTNAGQYVFITGSQQLVVDLDGNGLIQGNDLYVNLQGVTGLSNASVVLDATGAGGNINVTGTIGNDTVTLTGATVTASGTGTGLTLNGTLLFSGSGVDGTGLTYNGGSGSADTLVFASGSSLTSIASISGVENIQVSSGATGTVALHAGEAIGVTFATGAGAIALLGTTGADTVTLTGSGGTAYVVDNSGGFTLTGTTGVDTVSFSGASGATGTFDLGSGIDSFNFSGTGLHANLVNVENITGSSGVDTIHLTNTGADSILVGGTGGTGITWTTITSGDTIDLTSTGGVDTVTFGTGFLVSGTGATDGLTGLVINNFTAGASGTGDVLDFTALGLSSGSVGSGNASAVTGAGADVAVGTNGIAFVTVAGGTLSSTNFTTTGSASNGQIYIGDNNPHLIFAAVDTNATAVNVYLVDANAQTVGGTAGVDANEVHLIGQINLTAAGINSLVLSGYTVI